MIQSDEQILRVMNELMLQAANQVPATQEGAADARPQCHVAMKPDEVQKADQILADHRTGNNFAFSLMSERHGGKS